jgi:hypothetical protein
VGQQAGQRVLGRGARGQHDQQHALARQLRGHRGQAVHALHVFFAGELRPRRRIAVEGDDAYAASPRHAPRHVRSHPAQADYANFHVASVWGHSIIGSERGGSQ